MNNRRVGHRVEPQTANEIMMIEALVCGMFASSTTE